MKHQSLYNSIKLIYLTGDKNVLGGNIADIGDVIAPLSHG